ncbi:MAG: hypothetical protein DHS20C15_17710 [Planctomycetota bacterium]|nr:MAG: hypothetical protein DHS20C15_17710 [Planctomycetota bacterium]
MLATCPDVERPLHSLRARVGAFALLLATLLVGMAPATYAQINDDDMALLLGGSSLGEPEQHAAATVYSRVVGDELRLAIEISVDHEWHLYHEVVGGDPGLEGIGIPVEVTQSAEGVAFSRLIWPKPDKIDQSFLPNTSWSWAHHGDFVVYGRGTLSPDAQPDTLEVAFDGLTCLEDGSCVLYAETLGSAGPGSDALFADYPDDYDAALAAANAAIGLAPDGSVASEAADAPREFKPEGGELGDRGLGMWLMLAFIAGALLNVMPCVLPVISIKVLSFVQQSGEDKQRVLKLGLSFSAGIVVVFMALAAAAALAGAAWGEQFQSEAFQVSMIALVFAFALSLFGVFELGVPAGVGNLAGGYREGLGDAFAKGMLATALATPCSGPFLGSTLTWTLSQSTFTIFAVFLALGLGMAAPYVVLTANPALLKRLPKPGPWMDTFKQAMGFVLLATVLYLFTIVRSDRLLYVVFFLLFVGLACWWWGRFATYEKTRVQRWAHLVIAALILAGGAQATLVWYPAQLESNTEVWEAYTPEVLEEALADGRTVLLDFTADWCPNCKWNEAFTYETEEVLDAVARKDVLMLKADITHATPESDAVKAFMRSLGSHSIPFMAIFPGDDPSAPRVFRDIVTKGEVLGVLESLPTP